MVSLLKESGLDGLKGSIQYCADCGKPTVHYRVHQGWPICHACGYNQELERMAAEADTKTWRDMAIDLARHDLRVAG
ncbi:MAG TPA: hypothetical protein PKA05_12485 [Roseiflexaceae bacterium]|nr:hypothetical protein [Roseiflexaceae bacterium]HMP41193.1 hypothetical protein [Roseiflexaceae bacterium]